MNLKNTCSLVACENAREDSTFLLRNYSLHQHQQKKVEEEIAHCREKNEKKN